MINAAKLICFDVNAELVTETLATAELALKLLIAMSSFR